MAKIQLNKPLYDTPDARRYARTEKATKDNETPTPARVGVFGRMGAFILDLILLNCVLMAVCYFAHEFIVNLGFSGRWFGFALGFFYFGVGYSYVTGGKTLGKLLMRIQVKGTDGALLSLPRAFLRAALVLWPFPIYIIVGWYADRCDMTPTIIGWRINIWTVAAALIASWGLGNAMFAALDPCGRALFDHMAKTVQIRLDSKPDMIAILMRNAREQNIDALRGRPLLSLLLIVIALPATVGWFLYRDQQYLNKVTPNERALLIEYRQAINIPGFRFAAAGNRPTKADANTSMTAEERNTSTTACMLVKRGKIDVGQLEKDKKAMDLPKIQAHYLSESLNRAIKTDPAAVNRLNIPPKLRFKAQFMELADLFFAWHAQEVFSVSSIEPIKIDLPETPTTATATLTTDTETLTTDTMTSAAGN